MTTTPPAAFAFRDALVPLIQAHGRNPFASPWDKWLKLLKLDADGYSLTLGGPFETYEAKQVGAFHLLEVQHGGKELFALQWATDGTFELFTFERGDWEVAVVAAISALTVH